MKLTFCGAAKTVTGSKHLLTLKSGTKILLDCGFFQGKGKDTYKMNKSFPFEAKSIDYLILSHAHIDHSGNIPNLVKRGFNGPIYCTPATLDLCRIMLMDSAFIQEGDASFMNKFRRRLGKESIEPIYDQGDVQKALKMFETIPYNKKVSINDEVDLTFTDAGHILGSAVVNLKIKDGKRTHRLAYTGDVGRYINKILRTPQPFPQADTIICESTYGNKQHEPLAEAKEKLMDMVNRICVENRGKLVVPAFSVGKTQELVYTINKLDFKGNFPPIRVYVDSPLAINATEIMRNNSDCFSDATHKFMEKDPDPFGFNRMAYLRDVELSKALNILDEPAIIISASGMAEAGRVKHHLINTIENPKNGILMVGYSEPSSLGGKLQRGDKVVSIFGKDFKVNAEVASIDFFSAHADQNELVKFLSCQDPMQVKNMILVHGNNDGLLNMSEKLSAKGFMNIVAPDYMESVSI